MFLGEKVTRVTLKNFGRRVQQGELLLVGPHRLGSRSKVPFRFFFQGPDVLIEPACSHQVVGQL